MAKKQAAPLEHAAATLQALGNPGLLLVSRDESGRPNVMTIGWGSIGVYWRRPVFVAPVRLSRYTHGCITATGDFTVNVLPAGLAELAGKCGSVSGRQVDKFAEFGLTAVDGGHVRSPLIEQCVISYECRVVQQVSMAPATLDPAIKQALYGDQDYHDFFYGEILAVHAATDLGR